MIIEQQTVNFTAKSRAATLKLVKEFVRRSRDHYAQRPGDNLATEELSQIMMYGYTAFLAVGEVGTPVHLVFMNFRNSEYVCAAVNSMNCLRNPFAFFHCKVLDERWRQGDDLSDGSAMAISFLNRTFKSPFGSIFINSNGVKYADMWLTRFIPGSEKREVLHF